jgi:hypothetical protein
MRVPLFNLELKAEICFRGVRVVPLPGHEEPAKRIREIRDTIEPYLYTAYAVLDWGEHDASPPGTLQDAPADFWALYDALCFLQQRDLFACQWSWHHTSDCSDEPQFCAEHMAFGVAPYGQRLMVRADWPGAVYDVATLWLDKQMAESTGFPRAWRWTLQSLGARPLDIAYMNQWTSFELLVNRWAEEDPHAPQDVRLCPPQTLVKRVVRPAVREALVPLVEARELTPEQAKAITNGIRPVVRAETIDKAIGFIRAYEIPDVSRRWVRECAEARNEIIHGRGYYEAPQTLYERTLALRDVVNHFTMSLAGYYAPGWTFGITGPFYQKRRSPFPAPMAGPASQESPSWN